MGKEIKILKSGKFCLLEHLSAKPIFNLFIKNIYAWLENLKSTFCHIWTKLTFFKSFYVCLGHPN